MAEDHGEVAAEEEAVEEATVVEVAEEDTVVEAAEEDTVAEAAEEDAEDGNKILLLLAFFFIERIIIFRNSYLPYLASKIKDKIQDE